MYVYWGDEVWNTCEKRGGGLWCTSTVYPSSMLILSMVLSNFDQKKEKTRQNDLPNTKTKGNDFGE